MVDCPSLNIAMFVIGIEMALALQIRENRNSRRQRADCMRCKVRDPCSGGKVHKARSTSTVTDALPLGFDSGIGYLMGRR